MTANNDRYIKYRRIWIETTGGLPGSCIFCGITITKFGRHKGEGNIHHLDGNHDNDNVGNLALICVSCYFRHHRTGSTSWNKGQAWSPEMVVKLRESHLGQTAWNKGRIMVNDPQRECECEMVGPVRVIVRHAQVKGHTVKEVAL